MKFTYEQFVFEIVKRMREEMSQSTTITTCQARKNNGVIRRGICISKKETLAAPTIYLEEFYEKYTNGQRLEEIVHEIIELYLKVEECPPYLAGFFSDFEFVKEKIVYRLVNWEYNQELLMDVPHFRYLNLAIIFYVMVDTSPQTNASMLVTNEHLDLWNTDLDEIEEHATENTGKLLGYSFRAMESVLGEMLMRDLPSEDVLFVYSNKNRSYGASVILDHEKLGEIGDFLGTDYYILPCSVHEVIIVRVCHALPAEEMTDMVRTINRENVLREEILSDSIYYFNRKENTLLVMS